MRQVFGKKGCHEVSGRPTGLKIGMSKGSTTFPPLRRPISKDTPYSFVDIREVPMRNYPYVNGQFIEAAR